MKHPDCHTPMQRKLPMCGHERPVMKNDEWLTPPSILAKLGEFDLDPCAPIIRPWDTAKNHFTVRDNGMEKEWFGRVWLNPPFGSDAARWLKKLARHGNGIALIPARTETKMFFEAVWNRAAAVCFLKGRPTFCDVTGKPGKSNSGCPICLVAYGKYNSFILRESGLGFVVTARC